MDKQEIADKLKAMGFAYCSEYERWRVNPFVFKRDLPGYGLLWVDSRANPGDYLSVCLEEDDTVRLYGGPPAMTLSFVSGFIGLCERHGRPAEPPY